MSHPGVLPPANFRAALWAALIALLFAGCVSPAERELRTREASYRAALSTLKPNSTRADLNRLLPPTAVAKPHETDLVFSRTRSQRKQDYTTTDGYSVSIRSLGALPMYLESPCAKNFAWELHPVDADFFLTVAFEYQSYRRIRPPQKLKRSGNLAIDAHAIDGLLFGTWQPPHPQFRVYPRLRDRIVFVPPKLSRSIEPAVAYFPAYSPTGPHPTLTPGTR